MKKLINSLFLCLLITNVQAQKTDKAIGSVIYTFMHQRDTSSQLYYTEEMVLLFGNTSSVYVSRTKQINDSIVKAKIEQQLRDGLPVNLGSVSNSTKQNYYNFFKEQLAVVESPFLSNIYIFKDTVPKIEWIIFNEMKMIGEYKCQKASGLFAGRLYEAWFCPDISVNAGPWKLAGLPGLILEATDSKQQVKFLFKSIFNIEGVGISIILPSGAIKTTRTEFMKMVSAYSENPGVFSNNSGLDIKINKKPGSIVKNIFNNPLEIAHK